MKSAAVKASGNPKKSREAVTGSTRNNRLLSRKMHHEYASKNTAAGSSKRDRMAFGRALSLAATRRVVELTATPVSNATAGSIKIKQCPRKTKPGKTERHK